MSFEDLVHQIKGTVVLYNATPGSDYQSARVQYATMSADDNGEAAIMSPGAIVYPSSADPDADVIATINYAHTRGCAIAVRTGGHQYGGISSTTQNNIQLDLAETYKDFDWNDKAGTLRLGISYGLGQLDTALGALHLFVPHGQCTQVHVGGHAQTGGYGLPGRAFGLFADHIIQIRMITADGKVTYAGRNAVQGDADYNPGLFYAVLGGSPGNYGVLTEITLRPHRDADHPNSVGYKALTFYDSGVFRKLLDIKATMANDTSLPPDFDFCLTVINLGDQVLNSYGFTMTDAKFSARVKAAKDNKARSQAAAAANGSSKMIDTTDTLTLSDQVVAIIVWVEWANVRGKDYTLAQDLTSTRYFKLIQEAMSTPWFQPVVNIAAGLAGQGFAEKQLPMSTMTAAWVFNIQREFNDPYYKRTYVTTDATDLIASKWPEATVKQVDAIVARRPHCCVSVQIQLYGGAQSNYRLNDPEDKTSYSWRRTATVVQVMDGFYDPSIKAIPWTPFGDQRTPRQFVDAWQKKNDEVFKGPPGGNGGVLGGDRRVLWGSYESTPLEKYMDLSWPFYYESQEKYSKLVALKREWDPKGVFTPNAFCVGQAPPPTPLGPAAASAAAAALGMVSAVSAVATTVASHAVAELPSMMSWAPDLESQDSKKQRMA